MRRACHLRQTSISSVTALHAARDSLAACWRKLLRCFSATDSLVCSSAHIHSNGRWGLNLAASHRHSDSTKLLNGQAEWAGFFRGSLFYAVGRNLCLDCVCVSSSVLGGVSMRDGRKEGWALLLLFFCILCYEALWIAVSCIWKVQHK